MPWLTDGVRAQSTEKQRAGERGGDGEAGDGCFSSSSASFDRSCYGYHLRPHRRGQQIRVHRTQCICNLVVEGLEGVPQHMPAPAPAWQGVAPSTVVLEHRGDVDSGDPLHSGRCSGVKSFKQAGDWFAVALGTWSLTSAEAVWDGSFGVSMQCDRKDGRCKHVIHPPSQDGDD